MSSKNVTPEVMKALMTTEDIRTMIQRRREASTPEGRKVFCGIETGRTVSAGTSVILAEVVGRLADQILEEAETLANAYALKAIKDQERMARELLEADD